MTAPEPLRLTLEEALEQLYDKKAVLLYPLAADCWEVVRIDRASPFAMTVQYLEKSPYKSWPDAASAVLGVPVVERDDTAELIEALKGLVQVTKRITEDPSISGDLELLLCSELEELVATTSAAHDALARVR